MRVYLKICGLTLKEFETLHKKIELIRHQVYPDLKVKYFSNSYYPCKIKINQVISDEETAILLYRCLKSLNYTPSEDNKYDLHRFELSLDILHKWNMNRNLILKW